MNKAIALKDALTELFRCGADELNDADEMEELLSGIDFDALLQGLYYRAESVYEYHAFGHANEALHYHGHLLLPPMSVLLYEEVTDHSDVPTLCRRSLELWLLPDMSFAVLSCFEVDVNNGSYTTLYRTVKCKDWTETGMELDFVDLANDLEEIADQAAILNLPIYEV